MSRLDQRIALVTGAATGIGRATALAFAAEGAHVLCTDINADGLADTHAAIAEAGGRSESHALDVADETAVQAFADTVAERFGRLDVLVNNAGVDQAGGKLHEYPTELFDRILAVDLRGTFLVSKYLIPLMREHGGSIINVSSISGMAADLDRSGYNAAKGGVNNLTRAMAIDYARDGIRVNAICPGTVETPLVDALVGRADEADGRNFRESAKWVTPMGRLGEPREIGTVAVFLASDDASFVTGETIVADGGIMAYTWPGKMLFEKGWKPDGA